MANNYEVQAQQARQHFLHYDQTNLIEKFNLQSDEGYLYFNFLHQTHRIDRKSGRIFRLSDDRWLASDRHEEVMTILDLLCDSRDDRSLSGRWKGMSSFGQQFHQNLLEDQRDPAAEAVQQNPEAFSGACQALGGRPLGNCDLGFAVELFDGLEIGIQFWYGDDEFFPRLRYLWDEHAPAYLRYETMFYAVSVLWDRLKERINT